MTHMATSTPVPFCALIPLFSNRIDFHRKEIPVYVFLLLQIKNNHPNTLVRMVIN